ncbi:MAG: nucleoside hydrolase [Planctomycetota bacterium]|nr:nucleoside hydrolase [Planctomycetota bacterium]
MRSLMTGAVALALAMLALAGVLSAAEPVRIIFDTDMDSDCDDVAALAMLHALADAGEARILATMVSSKHPWSPRCVAAINAYYGRPDLPIGAPKGPGAFEQGSRYAKQIGDEFPSRMAKDDAAPDAARIYRQLLAAEPDRSVVIVTVGDLTNMRYLLESPPDDLSPLAGRDLVARKVKHWVCMGTRYPSDLDPKKWGNFKPDPESTVRAIAGWPTQIIFTGGAEFADSMPIGKRFAELPQDNPLRRAYELYFGGQAKDRHTADPIAVMVAVRGTGQPWKLVTGGYNHIFPNGTHEWRPSPDNPLQGYISALAPGASAKQVAAEMEELTMRLPKAAAARPAAKGKEE